MGWGCGATRLLSSTDHGASRQPTLLVTSNMGKPSRMQDEILLLVPLPMTQLCPWLHFQTRWLHLPRHFPTVVASLHLARMLQDAAAAVRMPYIGRPRANAVTHQSRRQPLARHPETSTSLSWYSLHKGKCTYRARWRTQHLLC
jgi:hypothetical protein